MRLNLDIKEDKQLRKEVNEMIKGEVVGVARGIIEEIARQEIARKIKTGLIDRDMVRGVVQEVATKEMAALGMHALCGQIVREKADALLSEKLERMIENRFAEGVNQTIGENVAASLKDATITITSEIS